MKKILKNIAKYLMKRIAKISPVFATKILFRYFIGKKLNLKNPVTLNEKMQWLKLYYYKNNSLVTKCVDKYLAREYVKECGCEQNLVKLLGVWDTPEEIDFTKLPNQFVLKCNHGSGSVIICRDKAKFNINESVTKLKQWLKEDFGDERAELSYKGIPKKVICEELIETQNIKAPNDYKFFCSYGKPKFLFCASDRHGEEAYFDFYNLDWEHLPVINSHPNSPVPINKPQQFEKMIDVASKLSKNFPLVRVDLYNEKGKVFFGEVTFLHFGGLHPFEPDKYDEIFGNMFDLSNLVNKKTN